MTPSITLDARQLRVLKRIAMRPESLRQHSKAQTIRLAARGVASPRIARVLGLSIAKVDARIEKFERKGIDWLRPTKEQLQSRREREEEHYDRVQFHRDLEDILEKDAELLRRLAQ